MEFLALVLLAPLIWAGAEGSPSSTAEEIPKIVVETVNHTVPRVEAEDGRWSIAPPLDSSLTMTVLEYKSVSEPRGPASVRTGIRRVDVIVTAP